CWVVADADRIEQVLDNLLDNAVKYSPGGGVICVQVSAHSGGWLVRVLDDGIGIPASMCDQIFEPFGRASNSTARGLPGMGLGLYICRQIAEAHGGRVWADSPGENEGAAVHLWLPCRKRLSGNDRRVA